MTTLVLTPTLNKSVVQRRGIVTVPDEDATASCLCVKGQNCNGIVVNQLPVESATLQRHLTEMGTRFIGQMKVRELELVGGDLRLHGPWPSYEFNKNLADAESSAWKAAERGNDPSLVLPFVIDQPVENGYSDYLLVGDFLARDVLVEVPDGN